MNGEDAYIKTEATKTLPQDIEKTDEEKKILQNQAIDFLARIHLYINSAKIVNNKIRSGAIDLLKVRTYMHESTEQVRQLIQLQYTFEHKLNAYLGRSIHFIWVGDDGTIYYSDEENVMKIYNLATSGSKSRARGNIAESQALKNELTTNMPENIEKNIQELINQRQKKYQWIYKIVEHSWQMNHVATGNGEKTYWQKYYPNTFWWRDPYACYWEQHRATHMGYDHSKKINQGHIKEAYINMVMGNEEDAPNSITTNIAENIKMYWNYMQNHKIINSTAGIQQGDVVLKEDGSIQFAVKSGSFSTASIGSYIKTAMVITMLDYKDLSPSNITDNILKHFSAIYNQKVKDGGLKILTRAINDRIKQINPKI